MPSNPPDRDADQQPAPSARAPKVDPQASGNTDANHAGSGAEGSPDGQASSDRYDTETAHSTPAATSDKASATAPK